MWVKGMIYTDIAKTSIDMFIVGFSMVYAFQTSSAFFDICVRALNSEASDQPGWLAEACELTCILSAIGQLGWGALQSPRRCHAFGGCVSCTAQEHQA